jgi:hypothetical protein
MYRAQVDDLMARLNKDYALEIPHKFARRRDSCFWNRRSYIAFGRSLGTFYPYVKEGKRIPEFAPMLVGVSAVHAEVLHEFAHAIRYTRHGRQKRKSHDDLYYQYLRELVDAYPLPATTRQPPKNFTPKQVTTVTNARQRLNAMLAAS